MLDENIIFYRMYSSKLDGYNRKVIPTRGKYVEHWRILRKKIKNINSKFDGILLSQSIKLNPAYEINNILNQIKK